MTIAVEGMDMREIREFLNKVILAKRNLKEAYYTTRDNETKIDIKGLVAVTIGIQRTLGDLIELGRESRAARKLMNDRKAEVMLKKWSSGLPRRVNDFTHKRGKIKGKQLHKFHEALLHYLESIRTEITSWVQDINTLREIPRPPKD